MQERHFTIRQDHRDTYITEELDAPPEDADPVAIFEFSGYRVGVYTALLIPLEHLEAVVRDTVLNRRG